MLQYGQINCSYLNNDTMFAPTEVAKNTLHYQPADNI